MPNNYLVIGDDEYIKEKEISTLRDKFLSESEIPLNYSCHNSEDIDNIIDSSRTMPFLSEKRVILVKNAHRLSERSIGTIISYFETPFDSSIMILSSDNSLKKNKKYRELTGHMTIIRSESPDIGTMKKWVVSFFKKEKVIISPEAIDLIVELKGNDTAEIKMELEKLICFSAGEKIEKDHVEQLVGRSVTDTVFKLVDAINSGNKEWAFRILEDLYDQKKQPQEIIGYLIWYIKVIQKISRLSGKGLSPEAIASEIKYSSAYTRRLLGQSRKYQDKRIALWTLLLFETDRDMKTGRRPAKLAIEMLLVSLLK